MIERKIFRLSGTKEFSTTQNTLTKAAKTVQLLHIHS